MGKKRTKRPLTPEEVASLKEQLLKKKEELWEEIRSELKGRVSEEYQELLENVKDEEELAQIDLEEEVILGVLEARKSELEAISQALWRIERGEYGKCLECGDWICIERLKVRPWASYCLDCKERLEMVKRAAGSNQRWQRSIP